MFCKEEQEIETDEEKKIALINMTAAMLYTAANCIFGWALAGASGMWHISQNIPQAQSFVPGSSWRRSGKSAEELDGYIHQDLIYERYGYDETLTLLNGWLHTIFTLSHLRCAVLFCNWLGPKNRTRLMLVPLRLSVGDMKEDITRITCNRKWSFLYIHWNT